MNLKFIKESEGYSMYFTDKERLLDKINTFKHFGDDGMGGITRYALSKEDFLAREEFKRRMEKAGCEVYSDDLANMYAVLKGSDEHSKKIVMASHCDSVKNGGNYDGILGVISAMEVIETISSQKIPHKHDIVAMIWTNEEGSLYPPAIMCSSIVCGPYLPKEIAKNYDENKLLNSKSVIDKTTTFKEALDKFPYKGKKENRINPKDYEAMFELHIEQGPILEANRKEVGVVPCVLGMCNFSIETKGVANHAGTTPMKYRKDALFAMAKLLIKIHEELDKIPDLVYTTGEINVHPCVHTVIPDHCLMSLDARHVSDEVIEKVKHIIISLPNEIEGCEVKSTLEWDRKTTYFNKTLVSYVEESVKELGYSYQYINSGAGHDAQFAAYMLPTTMIFVPSKDGRSHCDEEYSSPTHCYQACNVLLNAVLKCDERGIKR